MARYYSRGNRDAERWARRCRERERKRERFFGARLAIESFAKGEGSKEGFWDMRLANGLDGNVDIQRLIAETLRITRSEAEECYRIWSEQAVSFARTTDPFCTKLNPLGWQNSYPASFQR